jgi:nitroreductase
MEAIDLLLNRESAVKLGPPGPTQAELDQIFAAAVRAPDHGRLRPWRFVVIDEPHRGAFGDLMAESMKRREPQASTDMLQRERDKAFRSPCIVAVAAKLVKGHKIPEIEQIASASAAAQTILLATNALGYGAVWKTGAPAYDNFVKTSLGLKEEDEILGFLYIGKQNPAPPGPARPEARNYVSRWTGG